MIKDDSVAKITKSLDSFLFTEINLHYLAIFRILLAIIILFVFFYINDSGHILYTDFYNYYEYYDLYIITKPYLIIAGICVVLFGVGYRSRLFGFISVIFLFPLIFQYGLHISRQILISVLFSFSFLRSDQLLTLRNLMGNKTETSPQPIWPIRLIQIQLTVLYLVNAVVKSTPHFLSGEVLKGLSIMLPNFKVDLSNGYLDLGFIHIPVMLLGIATVVSEYFLAIGFWIRKLRIFTAIFGVIFHIILKQVVDIGFLDYVAVFLYLSFLIPWEKQDNKQVN